MESLGVPSDWQIVDVYGLEPDLLATVPQPVLAVMLLFPVTENVRILFKCYYVQLINRMHYAVTMLKHVIHRILDMYLII